MGNRQAAPAAAQQLTDINIAKILGLAKAALSQRKIAALMKCSKSAVQHTLTTYLFETFPRRNPWRQYKHKTTEREDRYIEHALKQNNSLPLRDIINIIDASVSEHTVRRRRDEAGARATLPAGQRSNSNPDRAIQLGLGFRAYSSQSHQ